MPYVQGTLSDLKFIAEINFDGLAVGQRPQPLLLLGPPGAGKTQWIKTTYRQMFADAVGVPVEEVGIIVEKPARRDVAELAGVGIPGQDGGELVTRFTMSPVIQRMRASGYKYIILMWDEATAAAPPEAKLLSDSLDKAEHQIGGHDLDADGITCIVAGTGNRAKDKAGSINMLAQNDNRVMVLEVEHDIAGWCKWARKHEVNDLIVECMEANGGDLWANEVPTTPGPFCTPRSTVQASDHLDAYMRRPGFNGNIEPRMERMLAMNIGEKAARVLTQWFAQRDNVPQAADIYADPAAAMLPDQTGFQRLAAQRAMANISDIDEANATLRYICRLRPDLQVPMGTQLIRDITRRGWLMTDPLAAAFVSKFHELLPLVQLPETV